MILRLGFLVVLVACGSGTPSASAPRGDDTGTPPDPAKLVRMMRDSAVNGGLWFDDPGCAKQFGVPGEIEGAKLSAFATCLEGLRLELSPRKSKLLDVVVLRYPPGFEVEARVVREGSGLRLTWIGFSSRRAGDLDVPTITHDALETLRLAGRRDGPLDPAIAGELDHDATWVKLCIDGSGAITKTAPFETTSPNATKAFLAAIASWKFRPFVTRGQPLPVCAMVRIAYPAEQTPAVETLPRPPPPSRPGHERIVLSESSKLVQRIAGDINIVPDDLTRYQMQEAGVRRVVAMFWVCIDEKGNVDEVLPLYATRFQDYDKKIMKTMHNWRYKPFLVDGQPVPLCTFIQFGYTNATDVRVVR